MPSIKWVLLSSFQQEYKTNMLLAALKEKGISYRTINKFDSAFNFMGRIEIYVEQSNFVTAMYVKENLDL